MPGKGGQQFLVDVELYREILHYPHSHLKVELSDGFGGGE
jgi:hypothetical protein